MTLARPNDVFLISTIVVMVEMSNFVVENDIPLDFPIIEVFIKRGGKLSWLLVAPLFPMEEDY